MVTKTITPVLESASSNTGADYAGYDFGQVNLDIIQFEANMFETYAKHDFASLQALDESSLQIINEMTIKEAVDKLVEFISSIWDKISQAFSRAITTLSAKFDTYGKFAKKMEEKVNSVNWVDSDEKVKSIAIRFFDKIDDFTLIPAVEDADSFIRSIMKYIDTGDENVLMKVTDKKEYFELNGAKNKKEFNSATLKDLTGQAFFDKNSFDLTCDRKNAMSIIDSLKNAKHTITSLSQTRKAAEKAFKKLKSEVSTMKKLERDVGKNKDEDILKVIATAQKAISTYSSIVNTEINASISALGKIYSSGMKTLQAMVAIAYRTSGNKQLDKMTDKNKHASAMKRKFEEDERKHKQDMEEMDKKWQADEAENDDNWKRMQANRDEIEGKYNKRSKEIDARYDKLSKHESADIESSWSGTNNAGDTWNDDQDEDIDYNVDESVSDDEDDDDDEYVSASVGFNKAMKDLDESAFEDFDVFGMILEGEFGDNGEFIEPGDPDVDETEPQIEPEKDNYENDPEDDDARPDLMDDSNSIETVTSEGLEFDDFDMLMMEEDFIEPGNPPVDETEPQYDPEKDNYENDPEDDDARPDLMDDSDGVETVTSEGYFDDIDSFFNEDDLL